MKNPVFHYMHFISTYPVMVQLPKRKEREKKIPDFAIFMLSLHLTKLSVIVMPENGLMIYED